MGGASPNPFIERTPIGLQCNGCAATYTVESGADLDAAFPEYGEKDTRLVSGREYFITNMEVY